MEKWIPIRFGTDVERDYANHLLARFIPLGRLAFIIGIVSFLGYGSWDLMLDPDALERTGVFRLLAALHFTVCLGITFLPSIRTRLSYWIASSIYTYCVYGALFTIILSLLPGGFVAGVGGLMLGLIFIPAMVSGVLQAASIIVPFVLVSALTMAVLGGTSFELINMMAWVGGGMGFALAFAYLLDVINRQAFHLERQLESEKQRSEGLLLNILPADIAVRLKAHEEPLADTHEIVSVLFADIAGFTDLARRLSAGELVNLLNDLFSRFDKLVEEHGAEKIKTIGDAYMAATGLKGSVADHAEKIADLALGMQKAFAEFRQEKNLDLKLRIGVHSGAVVAGVIGKRKFSYDLWGDTVNLASRMESEGIPDQIQISAETWKMLSNRYKTVPRGEIQIKGHRPRATYLLEGY